METTNKAIEEIVKKITGNISADDALKYSQAVLNLANAKNAEK